MPCYDKKLEAVRPNFTLGIDHKIEYDEINSASDNNTNNPYTLNPELSTRILIPELRRSQQYQHNHSRTHSI